MSTNFKSGMELKERIEKVLSEILSDQHGCKITLTFDNPQSSKESPKNTTSENNLKNLTK